MDASGMIVALNQGKPDPKIVPPRKRARACKSRLQKAATGVNGPLHL
jgi:hypothetical protein